MSDEQEGERRGPAPYAAWPQTLGALGNARRDTGPAVATSFSPVNVSTCQLSTCLAVHGPAKHPEGLGWP